MIGIKFENYDFIYLRNALAAETRRADRYFSLCVFLAGTLVAASLLCFQLGVYAGFDEMMNSPEYFAPIE